MSESNRRKRASRAVKLVGFLVNPIAGMGGRVGLKGTDGMVEQARALGAEPVAQHRAEEALRKLAELQEQETNAPPFRWLTCAGSMGEQSLRLAGLFGEEIEIVHVPTVEPTAQDTETAVRKFLARDVDLIFFCGGDGTARDICRVAGLKTTILGIPAGVKMYSGIFGTSPARAAEVLYAFITGRLTVSKADVLDLDETRYREDEWNVRLYHAALTPYEPMRTQSAKAVIQEASDSEAREEIAESLHEQFARQPGLLVLLGPGNTVKSVADRWGIETTLLGIDAVVDGKIHGKDLNERQILDLLEEFERCRLVLSPIGAQGFVLGRGNLQLSPDVIHGIGPENIIVIATPAKLARTPMLRFDTGDGVLDAELAGDGFLRVTTGYRRRRLVRVAV